MFTYFFIIYLLIGRHVPPHDPREMREMMREIRETRVTRSPLLLGKMREIKKTR